jgi:phosphoglycolate phosphatase
MDGTILESADAVMGRIARTLLEYGAAVPDRAELQLLLGPPTHEILGTYLPAEQVPEASAFYRGLAEADGMTGYALFGGMRELIIELHDAGIPLATATTKLRVEAALVVDHFDIGQYFSAIQGADPHNGVHTKGNVVAACLADLKVEANDRPIMVGDRIHDIRGAARCGVPTIMCEWGYAAPEEFDTAYARVSTAEALREELLREELLR